MSEITNCQIESASRGSDSASNEPRFLFIAGIMQRSGTTYLGRILAAHPELCRPEGHLELPLLQVVDRFIDFHSSFIALRKDGRLNYSFDEFAEAFGRGFLHLLWKRIISKDGRYDYLFHNNPGTEGIQHIRRFFPGARIVFLVRDGRDNVNSLMAAHGFRGRSWWNPRRAYLFYRLVDAWARSAHRILKFVNDAQSDCLMIKYEDLTTDTEGQLRRLSDYLDLYPHELWLASAMSMPVKGSNFYREGGQEIADASTPTCWTEVPKTQEFQPFGRWRSAWTKTDRYVFERIAGRELRTLGYCTADD